MTQPQPPTTWLYAYRLLGVRLPAEYRPWVAEDVASRSFLVWRVIQLFIRSAALAALYIFAQTLIYKAPTRQWVIRDFLLALAYALLASRATLVRRTLRWQRIDKHGRPVRPKRLATLGNAEAGILVLALAVAVTGASGVYAYGMRPSSPASVPCARLDLATTQRLTAGFRDPKATLVSPQVVKYDGGEIVATFFITPAKTKPLFVAFVIERGTVYELRAPERAADAATTFPPPTRTVRISTPALQRAVTCLGRAGPR